MAWTFIKIKTILNLKIYLSYLSLEVLLYRLNTIFFLGGTIFMLIMVI